MVTIFFGNMKKFISFALGILLLLSCTGHKTDGSIEFHKVPFMSIVIEGDTCRVLLDTGASLSVLDEEFVKTKGINYTPSEGHITTYTGDRTTYSVTDYILVEIGGRKIQHEFVVNNLSSLSRTLPYRICGIIGSDIMEEYGLVIDFKNKKILDYEIFADQISSTGY